MELIKKWDHYLYYTGHGFNQAWNSSQVTLKPGKECVCEWHESLPVFDKEVKYSVQESSTWGILNS